MPPRSFVDIGERVMNCQGIKSVSKSSDQHECAKGIGFFLFLSKKREKTAKRKFSKKEIFAKKKDIRADVYLIQITSPKGEKTHET